MGETENDNNAKLAAEARRGNRSAFAVLVRRTAQRLLCVLRAAGLSADDADDIMQEAYLRAWTCIDRYDPAYRFTTWLYTIGRRMAVSHHRRERPTTPLTDEPAAHDVPPATADGELWRRAAAVLSAPQYEVLWLRYAEGLAPREIARITGLAEGNVRVMLHRSRGELADALAPAAGHR